MMDETKCRKVLGLFAVTAGISIIVVTQIYSVLEYLWRYRVVEMFTAGKDKASVLGYLGSFLSPYNYFEWLPTIAGLLWVVVGVNVLREKYWAYIVLSVASFIAILSEVGFVMFNGFVFKSYPNMIGFSLGVIFLVIIYPTNIQSTNENIARFKKHFKYISLIFALLFIVMVAIYSIAMYSLYKRCPFAFIEPETVQIKSNRSGETDFPVKTRRLVDIEINLPEPYYPDYLSPMWSGSEKRNVNIMLMMVKPESKSFILFWSKDEAIESSVEYLHLTSPIEYLDLVFKDNVGYLTGELKALFGKTTIIELDEWRVYLFDGDYGTQNDPKRSHGHLDYYFVNKTHDFSFMLTNMYEKIATNSKKKTMAEMDEAIKSVKYAPTGNDAEKLFKKAMEEKKNGDCTGALFDLANAIIVDWDNPTYRFYFGECVYKNGKPCSASGFIKQAIEKKPDYKEASELLVVTEKACEKKREEEGK